MFDASTASVAETTESSRRNASTLSPGSSLIASTTRVRSSALRIVQCDSLFQMSSRANQLGEPEKKVSHQEMGVSEKAAILQLLGQLQAPLTGRKAYSQLTAG